MSENMEYILDAARRLPLDQQRLIAEQLLKDTGSSEQIQKDAQAIALEAVEKTHGTIKGLDRETIISLAEDEELCGY